MSNIAYWDSEFNSLTLFDLDLNFKKLIEFEKTLVAINQEVNMLDFKVFKPTEFPEFESLFDNILLLENYNNNKDIEVLKEYMYDTIKELDSVINILDTVSNIDISLYSNQLTKLLSAINISETEIESLSIFKASLVSLRSTVDRILNSYLQIDRNLDKTEILINDSGEFITTQIQTFSLKNDLLEKSTEVSLIDLKVTETSNLYCARIVEVDNLISSLKDHIEIVNSLTSKYEDLRSEFISVANDQTNLELSISAYLQQCDIINEFIRCLQLYESNMIQPGHNVLLEKENKVFKLSGSLKDNPMPKCPDLEYVFNPANIE